jgi:D-alanyl-D-alanine carboxypeptidase (penicillin-binding protein 5/6)
VTAFYTRYTPYTGLLLLLLLLNTAIAATPIPAPPTVAASSWLLVDFDSGRILGESNADERMEPASLTKILSAYVVMREIREGNIGLDDEVLVSKKAWRTQGSRMFIEVDKKVPVKALLHGMIIQSGNDASVALAEHIAGSEEAFAALMNKNAQRLGMNDTHFVNSTGLPDGEHFTTARDIARIAAATIREFPEFYPWYSIKEFTYNNIKQRNRNKLLWRDKSVDGLKTGHTQAAGYCLVVSARREGMRLISVVLGTSSENVRAKESQALLNYGFRFFETHRLYGAGEPLTQVRVWKGDREKLKLGLEKDLYVTIPKRQYKNLEAAMSIEPKLMAPATKGDRVGKVNVTLTGESVAEVPLVALESIGRGSLIQRAKDSVLLWFE